ncbi:MAG: 4Fe-4S binding protein [Spirochaetia bacterium]
MCVLRLPVTLHILFGFAIVLTLASGKKSYCAHYCPLGTIQDYYPPKERSSRELPYMFRVMRWPVFVLFWGYLSYITYMSFEAPETLWRSVFLLMLLSMATALILQTFVRKRVWCSKLCPLGTVLDGARKVKKR